MACGSSLLPPRDPALPPCQSLASIGAHMTNKHYVEMALLHDLYTEPDPSTSPWIAYDSKSTLSARTLELQTRDVVMTTTYKSEIFVQASNVERESNW